MQMGVRLAFIRAVKVLPWLLLQTSFGVVDGAISDGSFGRLVYLLIHGGFDKGGGNFFSAMTSWRIMFPDADIEAEMVSSLWNKFLRPLLYFVVVRSNHGEWLMRINMSSELMLISLGSDKLGSVSLLHWW
jgi:hypothetical protein